MSLVPFYGLTPSALDIVGILADDEVTQVYNQGNVDKAGTKGFYNVVRLTNEEIEMAELFAVNNDNFVSSN